MSSYILCLVDDNQADVVKKDPHVGSVKKTGSWELKRPEEHLMACSETSYEMSKVF